MNMLINWLLRLYPRAWRERYEEEFRALLEERGLSFFDVCDVVGGAVDARLSVRDAIRGDLAMETKRLLQVMGVVAVLCAALMFGALVNRTQQGWFDGGLMVMGQVLMLPLSIILHIACRQQDARRSARAFWITAACLVVGFVIFQLLRQQPDGNLTLGWQNIYIGGTFGLWITLNSRIAHATGLLPYWGMSLGLMAGGLWFVLTLVMLGMQLNPTDGMWMILIFSVAAIWLAGQFVWVSGLALWAFLPRRYLQRTAQV